MQEFSSMSRILCLTQPSALLASAAAVRMMRCVCPGQAHWWWVITQQIIICYCRFD
jgi:hypothetical protein